MSVDWVRAQCRCDRCMAVIEVVVDAAYEPTPGMAVFEIVEDAVRGGVTRDGRSSSVAGTGDEAEMLCASCTAIEDAKNDV